MLNGSIPEFQRPYVSRIFLLDINICVTVKIRNSTLRWHPLAYDVLMLIGNTLLVAIKGCPRTRQLHTVEI